VTETGGEGGGGREESKRTYAVSISASWPAKGAYHAPHAMSWTATLDIVMEVVLLNG